MTIPPPGLLPGYHHRSASPALRPAPQHPYLHPPFPGAGGKATPRRSPLPCRERTDNPPNPPPPPPHLRPPPPDPPCPFPFSPGAAQSAHTAFPGRWSSSASAFLLLSFAMEAAAVVVVVMMMMVVVRGGAGLRCP